MFHIFLLLNQTELSGHLDFGIPTTLHTHVRVFLIFFQKLMMTPEQGGTVLSFLVLVTHATNSSLVTTKACLDLFCKCLYSQPSCDVYTLSVPIQYVSRGWQGKNNQNKRLKRIHSLDYTTHTSF